MFGSRFRKIIGLFSIVLVLSAARAVAQEELSAGDIIASHLDSIGSRPQRAAVKNRMALGTSEFIIKIPYGNALGKALLASEASNILFLSSFASVDYPLERIGFFKSKVEIPFIKPGLRSPLGSYLLLNNKILSEGLFAGSMLQSWTLLDFKNSKARAEAAGKKKIDGRETYVLNYIPRGGFSSDASIKLFFDAENFRHLRTEYLQKLHTKYYPMGVFGQAEQLNASNLLVEEFGDFKNIDGLVLPHSYKVFLRLDGPGGTNEYQWNILINQYIFNQKFDPSLFSFDKNARGFDKNSY